MEMQLIWGATTSTKLKRCHASQPWYCLIVDTVGEMAVSFQP